MNDDRPPPFDPSNRYERDHVLRTEAPTFNPPTRIADLAAIADYVIQLENRLQGSETRDDGWGPHEDYPNGWWHATIHLNPDTGEMHSEGDHRVRAWLLERIGR